MPGETAMTNMKRNESTGIYRALSEVDLNVIVGGGAKAAAPPSKPVTGQVFEIDDFSFDIEQVPN
jgi:hypothetical protein